MKPFSLAGLSTCCCIALLLNAASAEHTNGATLYVNPGSASNIAQAVQNASPGDVVRLRPGTYSGKASISNSGTPENPIVIMSDSSDSAQYAVMDGGGNNSSNDKQCIVTQGSSWLEIKNIKFRNSWPNIVELRDSTYISVIGCNFQGGMHPVYTQGRGTHHILMDGCDWVQDTRIWTTWDWDDLHDGTNGLEGYNGGIYGGRDAAGNVVIRNNTIRYAYNGLRFWFKESESPAQSNFEVYDNIFEYCRDNHIEPETFTRNFHVFHNVLNSCPAGAFSIDKMMGGLIYLYGNVGRYSQDGGLDSTAWTVYKFGQFPNRPKGGFLDDKLYILHNSFDYYMTFGATVPPYSKAEQHIRHFNNAYVHQGTKDFGLRQWSAPDCQFDYDCTSKAWPADVINDGFEVNGISADPKFVDSPGGDFRLEQNSPCIDKGKVVNGFTLWYEGTAPDIGAYENGRPVYGVPYRYMATPGGYAYDEKPRIVRCFSRGDKLAVYFSVDLNPASLQASSIQMTSQGQSVTVQAVNFPGPARTPVLTLSKTLAHDETIGLSFSSLPTGANGQTATMWAANLKVVQVPSTATLVGEMGDLFGAAGPNQAPIIQAGPSATPNPVTLPGNATVQVDAFDPDNDTLSYTWQQLSGPGQATFTPNNTAASGTSTAVFPAAGDYFLKVTVSDARDQVTGTLSVTVISGSAVTLPVAHWKLDDGSGLTATDSSGNGNHGTLMNNPAWTTGRDGGAVLFDGSDDFIQANSVPVNTAGGAHNTVVFWMKWNDGNAEMPFGWSSNYALFLANGHFGFNTAEGNVLGISSAGLADRWVHVAAVFYNGIPSPSNVKLYIDGVAQTVAPRQGTTTASRNVSGTVFISGWDTGTALKFGGTMDDVRVYDHELSAAEIASLAGNSATPSQLGDANESGAVDMADLNLLVDWILGRVAPPAAGSTAFVNIDVDGSSTIGMGDLNLLVDYILGRITEFPVE